MEIGQVLQFIKLKIKIREIYLVIIYIMNYWINYHIEKIVLLG